MDAHTLFYTRTIHKEAVSIVLPPDRCNSTSAFGLWHCGPWHVRYFWNWLCNSENMQLSLQTLKYVAEPFWRLRCTRLLFWCIKDTMNLLSDHSGLWDAQNWILEFCPIFMDSNTAIKEHHLLTSSIRFFFAPNHFLSESVW